MIHHLPFFVFLLLLGYTHFLVAIDVDDNAAAAAAAALEYEEYSSVVDDDGDSAEYIEYVQTYGELTERWNAMFELVGDDVSNWIKKNGIVPDKINVVRPYFESYWSDYLTDELNILLRFFAGHGFVAKFHDEPFHEVFKHRRSTLINMTYCLYHNEEIADPTKYHIITPNGDDIDNYNFIASSRYDENINLYPGQMVTKYSRDPDADPTRCNETMNRKLLFITDVPEWYKNSYHKYQKRPKEKRCRLDRLCDDDHDVTQRSSNIFISQFVSKFVGDPTLTLLIHLDVIPSHLTLDHIEASVEMWRCAGRDIRFIRSLPIQGGFSGLVTGAGVLCHVTTIDNHTTRELNNIPDAHLILSRTKRHNIMIDEFEGSDNEGYSILKGISYEYPYKSGESYLEGGRCFGKNISVIVFPVV